MRLFLLIPYYARWHYSTALRSIVTITKNISWFMWHFFSVGLSFRTLLAPWQRIQEQRTTKLDIGDFFGTLLVNLIMRLVGVVVRGTFILIGMGATVFVLIAGIGFFIVWILLPLVVAFLVIAGFVFFTHHS